MLFRRLASTTTTTAGAPLKGWRKYAHQFRDKPASYMTTFALLHEITAIVPLPIVYYTLDYSGWHIPLVPQEAIAEGNRIMSKLRTRYGYEPLAPDSRIMVNLATSYAVVKAMMPLRIAASVALTPFFAERMVGPLLGSFRRLFRFKKSTTTNTG
ncbi:hypothetical protein RO3G_13651 [Lichtheimia corymbifera JMRC:FSU:9682]|uniref:DUF1279 domain-containing protein n=1 Tax=Lichtheimia corymbifera JMRC:FSU:9682 TaxID=1263082 RepID=A0A068SDA2_9FUNG|nr:hypothetical protein RO3G_13651 [Lichtheimia corymbifera JMRC:FSU:9682]